MREHTNQNPSLSSARQKAVREAWAQERQYVLEGKGTRDWTPQQQNDIINGKTPKDEQGRPYEGHHMVSVSNSNELAGSKENIQFLSHDEHIQGAHQGKTRNKTEGRYDPDSGKTYKFTEKEPITPAPKELTNPVIDREKAASKEMDKEPSEKEKAPAKPREAPTRDPDAFRQSVKTAADQPEPVRENGSEKFASNTKDTASSGRSSGEAFASGAKGASESTAPSQGASNFASSAKSAAASGQSASASSQSAGNGTGQSTGTGQSR